MMIVAASALKTPPLDDGTARLTKVLSAPPPGLSAALTAREERSSSRIGVMSQAGWH